MTILPAPPVPRGGSLSPSKGPGWVSWWRNGSCTEWQGHTPQCRGYSSRTLHRPLAPAPHWGPCWWWWVGKTHPHDAAGRWLWTQQLTADPARRKLYDGPCTMLPRSSRNKIHNKRRLADELEGNSQGLSPNTTTSILWPVLCNLKLHYSSFIILNTTLQMQQILHRGIAMYPVPRLSCVFNVFNKAWGWGYYGYPSFTSFQRAPSIT